MNRASIGRIVTLSMAALLVRCGVKEHQRHLVTRSDRGKVRRAARDAGYVKFRDTKPPRATTRARARAKNRVARATRRAQRAR